MLTDLLGNRNSIPTPLRRPVFSVSLSTAANNSGRLDNLANAIANPVGAGDDGPWREYTSSIRVESVCAPYLDQAIIQLAPGSQSPAAAFDDEAAIGLGYADDETRTVFTGRVDALTYLHNGQRRISLGNAGQILARSRINKSFQQSTAADIVRQLLSAAGVDTGDIADSSAKLPVYVADDSLSIYQHISRLAEWCGHIAYINVENRLNWVSVDRSSITGTFVYGDNVISAEKLEQLPCAGGLRWQGEGAAGSQGNNAWSWLSKSAEVNCGSEASQARVQFQGALRSVESVEQAATGFTKLPQCRPVRLQLLVAGAADITVGGMVVLTGTPGGKLDVEGLVTRLTHSLSKSGGFTTRLELVTLAQNDSSELSLGGPL